MSQTQGVPVLPISPLADWMGQKIEHPQGWTAADLAAYQLQKLNETLAWARQRSRFYRQHLSSAPDTLQSLAECARLPFTTAEDLREEGMRMVCVSQDEVQRVVTLQTSGTTGAPKRVYFSAADQELTVDFFDVGMTTLTRPGDRVLILLPGERPGGVGDLLRQGLLRQGRIPIPYGAVRDPLHALATMQSEQADCLVGSPTQVLGLARRWRAQTAPGKAPRTVLLSTDTAPAAIRRELQRIWGCEVYDHYGSTEMGLGGGVECAARRGYHLREADLYFEIVDPHSGAPVAEGQYGEVVFSTLTRRAMPLIRYRTGDRSRFVPGPCPCGAPLRTLAAIGGRFSGIVMLGQTALRLPDLDEALFSIPDLLNFSATVQGTWDAPEVLIEARMLTETDAAPQMEQALSGLPALRSVPITLCCEYFPAEPGSLSKRTILDKRGEHA